MAFACRKLPEPIKRHWRVLPLLLAPVLLSPLLTIGSEKARCAYLLLLMATYWVLELLPLSLTAVLPFFLGPLLRIGTCHELAKSYFTDIHFLMIGGVMLSVAMEDTGLSRRFALRTVALLGTRPRWLLLGFMLPSWLMSMWMSNTGTTILMFPFVMAAIAETEKATEQLQDAPDRESLALDQREKHPTATDCEGAAAEPPRPCEDGLDSNTVGKTRHKTHTRSHAVCYCLSVAYACNVGGVATLIGTGTNLVLVGQLQQIYRVSNVVTFSNWMAFSLPLSLFSLLLIWLLLQLVFVGPRDTFNWRSQSAEQKRQEARVKLYFHQQLEALGSVSFAEWATMAAFPCVLLLLLTGKLTSSFGWHYLFGSVNDKPVVSDATGMLLVALLLTLIPNPDLTEEHGPTNSLGYRAVARWDRVLLKIPLDIMLLIGGGLALAKLTKDTKLSETIGSALTPTLQALPTELTLLLLSFCVIWLTEVTSNMATASVLLPIVAQIAACLGHNPLLFMVSLTVTCSFAFCLPTATPPNAIVFGSGRVSIPSMAKAGLVLNLVFSTIVPFYTMLVGRWVYNVHELPEWAETSSSLCANETFSG
ncbi:hypothetical protein BOX15_Mlig006849g2 [Macrostomum lignano]|uniref:Uncharacterized protein n=1 Tax=Macrostomum lignano TaxID=282301 RepID=A0A267FZ98_9PLAT|nr:hypothetical protein BOX15_Mlig006849g2 [Macrostomum lignano]